ncbi:hypothetical protein [Peribacillus frigoritolerans]|uniref:hypothetical protein n=1 Tax=Peribacillus frigoritolerans TaxID=450367 RepID=UPI003F80C601
MIQSSTNYLFRKTKRVMTKLNDEYENMSELNKINSVEIRKSIQQKSDNISVTKKQRSKHFDFIRNK